MVLRRSWASTERLSPSPDHNLDICIQPHPSPLSSITALLGRLLGPIHRKPGARPTTSHANLLVVTRGVTFAPSPVPTFVYTFTFARLPGYTSTPPSRPSSGKHSKLGGRSF